jgi:hypothetical protein
MLIEKAEVIAFAKVSKIQYRSFGKTNVGRVFVVGEPVYFKGGGLVTPFDTVFPTVELPDHPFERQIPEDQLILLFLGKEIDHIRTSVSPNIDQAACMFTLLVPPPQSLKDLLRRMLESPNAEQNRHALRVIGTTVDPELIESVEVLKKRADALLLLEANALSNWSASLKARASFAFADEYVSSELSNMFERWKAHWGSGRWDEVRSLYAKGAVELREWDAGGEQRKDLMDRWAEMKKLGSITQVTPMAQWNDPTQAVQQFQCKFSSGKTVRITLRLVREKDGKPALSSVSWSTPK